MPRFRHNHSTSAPLREAIVRRGARPILEEGKPMTRIQSIRAIAMIAGTVVLLGCEQTNDKDAANNNQAQESTVAGGLTPAAPESAPAASPTPAPEESVAQDAIAPQVQ